MASYTAQQLSGEGTPIEAISGQKTFTLTKPSNLSGSAYFTIETVKNSSGNYASKPTNALGTYATFANGVGIDTLVTSSYISSVVIDGNSTGGSYKFTPTANIAVSSSFLRATGGVTLTIS